MKRFVSFLCLAIAGICQTAAQVQPELPTELAVDEPPVAAAKAVQPKNSLTNTYEKLLAQPSAPQEPVALPPPPPSPPTQPKKPSLPAKPAKASRVLPAGPNGGPQIAPAAFPVAPNSNKQQTLQDILKQQQQQGAQQQQLAQLQQGSVKGQVKPALAPIRGKPKPAPKMKESTLVWQNREKQLDAVQAIYENGGRITFKSEQFIRGYVPDSVIKRFQLGCTWCLQDPKGKGCICTKLQLVPKQKVTNLKANVVKPGKPQAAPGGKEPTTPSGARDVGAKPPNNEDKDPKSTQPPPTTPISQDAEPHADTPEVKVSEATRETFEKAFNQGFAAGQTAQNLPVPQSGQDKPKEGNIQKPSPQDQQPASKPADKPEIKAAVVPPAKKEETPQASVQTPAAQNPAAAAVNQVQVPPTAPSKPSSAVEQLNALAAGTQQGIPAVATPTDASKTAAQAFAAAAAVPPSADAAKPFNLAAKPEPKIESGSSKLVIEGSPSAQPVIPAQIAPATVPSQQQPAITSVFIPPEAKKEEVKAAVLPQVLPPLAPVTLVEQTKKEEPKAPVPPAAPKAAVKPALVAEEPGDDDPLTGENQQASGSAAVVQPDKAAGQPVAAIPVPPSPVPVPAPPLASATKPEDAKVAVAPTNQAAPVQAAVAPKVQTNVSPVVLPPPTVVAKPDAQSPTLLAVAKEEKSSPALPVQLPPFAQEKKEEIKPVATFPQILPEVHNDPVPAAENVKPVVIPNGSPQPQPNLSVLPAQGSPAPLNQASSTGPGTAQVVHPTLPQILHPAQPLPGPAVPLSANQSPPPQQSGSVAPQQPAAAGAATLTKP